MSMNDKERIECLLEHCNLVLKTYGKVLDNYGFEHKVNDDEFYLIWDRFMDAVENIEEGLK